LHDFTRHRPIRIRMRAKARRKRTIFTRFGTHGLRFCAIEAVRTFAKNRASRGGNRAQIARLRDHFAH